MKKTTQGKIIEKWVKAHNGKPAIVSGTKDLLRIRFDDLDSNLDIITWFEFFKIFNKNNLVFLYQTGTNTRFCKFISKSKDESKQSTWKLKAGKLQKTFILKDFLTALKLVNDVAQIAQKQNHHPDMCIHDYKKVTISTKSHEKNEITQKDAMLADKIDEITI